MLGYWLRRIAAGIFYCACRYHTYVGDRPSGVVVQLGWVTSVAAMNFFF
jgi:hypothetical protein